MIHANPSFFQWIMQLRYSVFQYLYFHDNFGTRTRKFHSSLEFGSRARTRWQIFSVKSCSSQYKFSTRYVAGSVVIRYCLFARTNVEPAHSSVNSWSRPTTTCQICKYVFCISALYKLQSLYCLESSGLKDMRDKRSLVHLHN